MALVNIMEQIVGERLDKMLAETDFCKCDICRTDMMAFALNQLKAQYVNSLQGELIVKIRSVEIQNLIDIDIAILKAIELVGNHPRHK